MFPRSRRSGLFYASVPHTTRFPKDGRTAYVSNFGRYNNPCPQGEVIETIDSGGAQPQRVRVTPDGKDVWSRT